MAEMGKCPYQGADKVPKCERPNGFKSDCPSIPESSKTSESSQRLYDNYGHKPRAKDGSQDVHGMTQRRYEGEPAKDMSTSSDRRMVNGSPTDNRDGYVQTSQHVPYWMVHRGQGLGQRSDERSTSPRQRYGESSGTKRPFEREEDPKRKVAKIWDVPIGESTKDLKDPKESMVNADGRPHGEAPRMYPYPPRMLPGQQFLPYPSFPREFRHRPSPGAGNLPSNMIPRSSQSDVEKQMSRGEAQKSCDSSSSLSSKGSQTSGHSKSSPPTNRSESSLNLPVLKSVLSSPPLSSTPMWSTDKILGRRHSNEDATGQASQRPPSEDRSHSEDYVRDRASALSVGFEPIPSTNSSKCTSPPSDPYFMHKKLKMKHRTSLSSRSSDRSTPVMPDDSMQFGNCTPPKHSSPGLSGENRGLTSRRSPENSFNHNENSGYLSPRTDSYHQIHYENNNITDVNSESIEIHKKTLTTPSSISPTNDQSLMQSDKSLMEHSVDKATLPDTPHFPKHNRVSNYASSDWNQNYDTQHKVNYHNIKDHIGESFGNRHRLSDSDNKIDNNNVKSTDTCTDRRKDQREVLHYQRHSEKEHPIPPHGFGSFPGPHSHPHTPGAPPHPAYLPQMAFPPGAAAMHPALLYQYNQYAAGLQLAQLQHLQMAQAAHMAHAAHVQMQASQDRSHPMAEKDRTTSPTGYVWFPQF